MSFYFLNLIETIVILVEQISINHLLTVVFFAVLLIVMNNNSPSFLMGTLFILKNKIIKKNKNADNITEKDRAILDLKTARDKLKKYRKKVTLT
jgi:hypothetical protein